MRDNSDQISFKNCVVDLFIKLQLRIFKQKKKSFSSEPEDDNSGGSLARDGPVIATFSSTVEFNHIKTNVALVDSASPLDVRRKFSR